MSGTMHSDRQGLWMTQDFVDVRSAKRVAAGAFSGLPASGYWSRSDQRELKLHRIHAYPAKFPAFITHKALEFARKRRVRVRTLGDVFCGCGTVAFEARRSQIDFWGCDINPVATLIARTKSTPYNPIRIEAYRDAIVRAIPASSARADLSADAMQRLAYWFSKSRLTQLAKLLNAIRTVVPARSPYRDLFLCAFSNILKPTSRWLTKSIKPQIDPGKTPAGVVSSFRRQCDLMIDAWKQSEIPRTTKAHIVTASVLELAPERAKADLLVTSPPYVTSYEYADLHQLSSLWLGFASDYRSLREGSIGTTQHNLDFNREVKGLNRVGTQIVFSLYDRDKGIARSTAKYFLDMQAAARQCHRLIRAKGMAVFVIGNTEYKGVRVDNAAHLTEALLASGFRRVRVAKRRITRKILTPYRDNEGRFSGQQTGRQAYAEEFVLIASR